MVEHFVAEYAKLIAVYPEDISVSSSESDDTVEITLFANQEDIGKLIDKDGKMINSIKTVISGCKAKDGKSYRINVQAI